MSAETLEILANDDLMIQVYNEKAIKSNRSENRNRRQLEKEKYGLSD